MLRKVINEYSQQQLDLEIQVKEIASFLGRGKEIKTKNGYLTKCPCHDDTNPSLHISNGITKLLFHCFAGCSQTAVITKLKELNLLKKLDTFKNGLTLEELAFFKKLDVTFLKEVFRLETVQLNGRNAVFIGYFDENKNLVTRRFRAALSKSDGKRFFYAKGDRPMLYGLWIDINKQKDFIILVEGESDTWTLIYHGFPCLGIPEKAIFKKEWITHLENYEKIYIWREPDAKQFPERIAKYLNNKEIYIIATESFQHYNIKDPSDLHVKCYFENLNFKQIFNMLLNSAIRYKNILSPSKKATLNLSHEDILNELTTNAELFHDNSHKCYIKINDNNAIKCYPITSRDCRRFIQQTIATKFRKFPSSFFIDSLLLALEGIAMNNTKDQEVYNRVAYANDAIFLFLANERHEAIKITANGWNITHNEVNFVKRPGMLPLPYPKEGGTLSTLRDFLNVKKDSDFILIVAWLLGALHPQGPYPVLVLRGEHGSAKSTCSKLLKMLVDPSVSSLEGNIKSERDLLIAASNSHLLVFDNLSTIPAWFSDALCRIASGTGMRTRALYTNDDEIIFKVAKPIILNSITELVNRADLADRCIFIELDYIPEELIKTEKEIYDEFNCNMPYILGALCNAVCTALSNIKTVNLPIKPRMADFATWVVAAEPALPWESGQFLEVYMSNRNTTVIEVLASDPVAETLLKLLEKNDSFAGSSSELFGKMSKLAGSSTIASKSWPKTPSALSKRCVRMRPLLRRVGFEITFRRDSRRRYIEIKRHHNKVSQSLKSGSDSRCEPSETHPLKNEVSQTEKIELIQPHQYDAKIVNHLPSVMEDDMTKSLKSHTNDIDDTNDVYTEGPIFEEQIREFDIDFELEEF